MFRVMTAMMILGILASGVGASEPRTDSADYTLLVSNMDPSCGDFTPSSSPVCFPVRAGETTVALKIEEASQSSALGMPIYGSAKFVGGHAARTLFCGEGMATVPPGATLLIVEVHTRGPGFCDGIDSSPALYGTVTATFT